MNKARCVFIQLYARSYKILVMRFRQGICALFIGYARKNEPYIYTSLCGKFQRRFKLVVKYQIWRHYVYIAFCTIEYVHINILTDFVSVKGIVTVGHYITIAFNGLGKVKEFIEMLDKQIRERA